MSTKTIEIDDIGIVKITKKRGMKTLRMRIGTDNEVLISAPYFVPITVVKDYIRKNKSWIDRNRVNEDNSYYNGYGIGRFGRIQVVMTNTESVRLSQDGVVVKTLSTEALEKSSEKITKAVHRYLQRETENNVLPRLLELSQIYNLEFHQATYKRLRGRWGSCDSKKNISINTYLTQLDTALIDYVLIHELSHTKHMNHSKAFWEQVTQLCPNYKELRKTLKKYRPKVYDQNYIQRDYAS